MRNYQYCISQSGAHSANVNILPSLRQAIQEAFDETVWTNREAAILSIDMRSGSAFTVSLNAHTTITAALHGDEYVVQYDGSISFVKFAESTTLTYMNVEWFIDRKNHRIPTFDAKENTTVTLKDTYGDDIVPVDTNEYELQAGTYCFTATHADYATVTGTFVYNLEDTVKIYGQAAANVYEITFATTPVDASIVVLDPNGVAVAPIATHKYMLQDATIVGAYTYTVSATGYADGTGEVEAQAKATVTVTPLVAIASIAITTPPTTTAYQAGELFDKTGMVVTATFNDESTEVITDYTWSPSAELSDADTSVVVSYTFAGVTKTATQAITVSALASIAITTPPTKTTYYEGEDFETTGMVVTATFADASTAVINGYTVSPVELSGTDTTVEISMMLGTITKTATQNITVLTLSAIDVTAPPTKTAYIVGDLFDPAGMVVRATYSDTSTALITDYTYEPSGALALTDTAVTVSSTLGSQTKTDTTSITVTAE